MLAAIEARDNVRLIREWSAGQHLDAIWADRKARYAIEPASLAVAAGPRHSRRRVGTLHKVSKKSTPPYVAEFHYWYNRNNPDIFGTATGRGAKPRQGPKQSAEAHEARRKLDASTTLRS